MLGMGGKYGKWWENENLGGFSSQAVEFLHLFGIQIFQNQCCSICFECTRSKASQLV